MTKRGRTRSSERNITKKSKAYRKKFLVIVIDIVLKFEWGKGFIKNKGRDRPYIIDSSA